MSRTGFDLQTRAAPQLPRAGAGASPRWPRRGLVRSRPALALSSWHGRGPRVWVFAGLVIGALASSWLEPSSFGGELSRRIAEGCDDPEACRALEAEAERRANDCWLWCRAAFAEQKTARLLRHRAEERSAVREHYRRRSEAERSASEEEKERELRALEREQLSRSLEVEQARLRERELEHLRQEREDRRQAAEHQRRVNYLTLLGMDGRARLLRRCHRSVGPCDRLILDLLEACADQEEQKRLAELNEDLLTDSSKDPA